MQPLCDDYFREIGEPRLASRERLDRAIRAYLAAAREHLEEAHSGGGSARLVNQEHADLIDRLIRKLFRLLEDRYFEENPRLTGFRLAVLATGGYGRREMALASDVDLLFLHRGKLNPYVETLTEAMTQRLWDARLVVGAAVRTVPECMRVGREDLPTLTSYLDARFLVGDPALFAELERRVERHVRSDPLAFVTAKLAEQEERHARFGESPYLLQPNVRESVGGLRDYHTALWVARAVHWEVRRLEHLQLHSFVDERELEELRAALEFQWRVRNELHRTGRKDDRLHFEAQGRLVDRLGFEGGDHQLPVEQLMQSYYRSARVIGQVAQRVTDHALDLARHHRAPPAQAVEDGFALVGDHLEIPHASVLASRPARMLSAFTVAQAHDVSLSPRAQALLRQHLYLVDDALRKDPEAIELFRRILSAERRVYRTLVQMNELGILGAFVPEFAHLVGLWQHDLYHTYTVDTHSLFLVEQLRRLGRGQLADELPLASELIREVRSPPVLFLGCILHDIGKGRGGAHSAKGARLVPEIGRALGLDEREIDHLRFLVLHHLTMSAMAERRDVNDPRVILNLANVVGSRSRLRNLYLLTVADVRSVSPEAWTPWKGGLLEQLYRNTAEWLETGIPAESAPGFFLQRTMERAERVQAEALGRLAEAGVESDRSAAFLDGMPRRYLLSHGASEIADQVRAALDFVDSGRRAGVYLFRPEMGVDPFLGLVVLAPDQAGLLATMTGVLRGSGHDILGAQIYTTREGLAVQIYEARRPPGGEAEDEVDRERLERQLTAVLEGRQSVDALLAARRPVAARGGRERPAEVRVTNEDSDFYTIVDVAATDRPGLLHDMTRALSETGVDIVMSRVSTRASRVNDSFFVTEGGNKILAEERQTELREALLRAIQRVPQ